MTALSFDVFWSFRSPYSYLVTPRLYEFVQSHNVVCNYRPVLPIAVRIPGFFKDVNPLWPPYVFGDTTRLAAYLDIPYAWPSPDPIVMDFASGTVDEDQPYIHRLTRLGVAAAEAGRGLDFAYHVSREIFGGTKDWDKGTVLADAAGRAGCDLADLDAKIAKDPAHYDGVIEQNEADQKLAGHWGVPLMAFEGEGFFGQDRLDIMIWRMKQKGLEAR